ncbi:MAG: hypothetical protein ACI8XB_000140 [Patiriisocius sp.]|jgi:hypothetical protein
MDTKTVGIIGNVVKFGLGIGGMILCFMILFNGENNGADSLIDLAITISIAAIVIAFAIAVLFAIYYFATNIKNSKGAMIGIAALLVVVLISYSLASGNLMAGWSDDGVTESISKWSGTGIYAFLILTGVAVVAALFSEVSKIIK